MTKVCIAGKNTIAVNVLEYILKNKLYQKNEIVVICNKTENGKNTWQKSLRYFARRYGIREVSLNDIYDIPNILFLSLEFDAIVRPNKFKTKFLYNIHFSALPKYKGMYTSALPLINNEKEVGVTFHHIDAGIDTGDIVDQYIFPMEYDDTSRDLYRKFVLHGTRLVCKSLRRMQVEGVWLPGERQRAEASSYYSRKAIDYQNLNIDLNQTAISIRNQIRAFHFREYQMPMIFDKNIAAAKILNQASTQKPGKILWQDEQQILISTIDYDTILYIDKYDEIMQAAEDNDVERYRRVINPSLYVNEQGKNGWTPLMVAAYNGKYDIAMALIADGADINTVNWNGTNLLMYAKDGWLKNGDARLFEYLIEKGLSLNSIDYKGVSLRDYCLKSKIEKIGNILITKGMPFGDNISTSI